MDIAALILGALVIVLLVLALWLRSKARVAQQRASAIEAALNEAQARQKQLEEGRAQLPLLEEKLRAQSDLTAREQSDAQRLRTEVEHAQNALAEAKATVARHQSKLERLAQLERELDELRALSAAKDKEAADLRVVVATTQTELTEQQRANEEKLAEFKELQALMQDQFKAVSGDVVRESQAQLLELAQQSFEKQRAQAEKDQEQRKQALLAETKPLQQSIEKLQFQVVELDKSRSEQVGQLHQTITVLSSQQLKLTNALKRPSVRGRFGEIQLQNALEAAGMSEYCDFVQQCTHNTAEGQLRPDVLVRLPNNRCVVVDAKMPLDAYLASIDATESAEREQLLCDHARQVRSHITGLSGKGYAQHVDGSPEFVVMFVPYDAVYQAALEKDGSLFDYAVKRGVLIATPMTLIAMLHAVAMGWREERLAENAAQVSELGRLLHERLAGFAGHLAKVGGGLKKAVEAYNKSVGTFDTRVMVTARKFDELDAKSTKELAGVDTVDVNVRVLAANDNEALAG